MLLLHGWIRVCCPFDSGNLFYSKVVVIIDVVSALLMDFDHFYTVNAITINDNDIICDRI